ncbi:hypothetical protein pSalSNUABM01_122 [Salmonella phage pSal-SNUABM-01]|nr:hypothetical protein pSalSNUABM01_122 [Salmonella phage pSal-SNUABM-01]
MITACRLFGYSAVVTFLLTLIFVFVLLLCGFGENALAMAFVGGIFAGLQGAFWACNK